MRPAPIAAIALLLGILGTAGSIDAAGDVVTVSGVVRNGTRGAAPGSVAGLKVRVGAVDKPGSLDADVVTVSDGSGTFTVEDVEPGPGRKFVAWVEYAGVVYRSDTGSLPAGARRLDLVVDIFETEERSPRIDVGLAHTVVELQRDHLFVTQVLAVENPGDRTIVGTAATPSDPRLRGQGGAVSTGRAGQGAAQGASGSSIPFREVLRIPLPREVSEVRFQDEALSSLSKVADGTVMIGRPLPPGRSQVIFSYLLPRQRETAQFAVAYPYGAAKATVLIPDVGLSAAVDGLLEVGTLQTEGQRKGYLAFSGEEIPPGRSIAIRLSAIPTGVSSFGAPQVSPPDQSPYWAWSILGLGLVALALAFASLLRVRKDPGQKS